VYVTLESLAHAGSSIPASIALLRLHRACVAWISSRSRAVERLPFAIGEACMESRYRPGTIVHARGRDWIVLPPREPEVLQLRPLTTAQGNEVGLSLPLEGDRVRPARFTDPEPVSGGDATGIMTLFDAARLSLRSGAGPFRSLGRISVIPRPYQFVINSCR
jgi:hypothetical protein